MLQAFTKHSIQISVNIIEKFPSEIDLSVKLKFKSLTEKLSLNKITHKLKKIVRNNFIFGFRLYLSSYKPVKKKVIKISTKEKFSLRLRWFSIKKTKLKIK
tara:strand:+ start:161 stop:463 length:303 start_codon:yes stop_codon:yes gene_type:complete